MRSLLWKEWHEQRWKLAFATMLLAGFTFCGLHARVVHDIDVLMMISVLSIILQPLLVGAVLVSPERESRTLTTLLSLPVKPRRVLLAKTLVGLLVCAGPIIIACLLSVTMAGGRETRSGTIVFIFLMCLLTTLSLFAWNVVLTIRIPSETRSTLLSIGIIVGWLLITAGLAELYGSNFSPADSHVAVIFDPFYFVLNSKENKWPVLMTQGIVFQILVAVVLWLWAASRFKAEEGRS